jgi:hypothetical protein
MAAEVNDFEQEAESKRVRFVIGVAGRRADPKF